MKVGFEVLVDGNDATADFNDRLVSITITDEPGSKSDTAKIVIDNRDELVELPPVGAVLEISLGLDGDLTYMGQYTVDDLGGEFFPATMTIEAKAANMRSGIRAPKTRHWADVTVGDIVSKIAGEHGLEAKVGDSLQGHFFSYLAQTSESDLGFLNRLARDLDALTKPAGGALLFLKHGEGKSADGQELSKVTILREDISTGSWNITGRGRYGRVVAEWGNRANASVQTVSAGSGDPELKLRHRYPNQDEAQRAVDARLSKANRASGTMNLQLGGFFPDLIAESPAQFPDLMEELQGEWLSKRVTHTLTNTLTTSLEVERDNETEG